jgi:hypothetical protein
MSDPKPRSVVAVIFQLIKEIPENERDLIQDLKNYADGLWNIAPELLECSTYWNPLENILKKHIEAIDTEWKKTLVKIHNNTPDL